MPLMQPETLTVDQDGGFSAADISGYIWVQPLGVISLSGMVTLDYETVKYGVTVNRDGQLFGSGWSENVGWIDFSPPRGGGVAFDENGNLHGFAWNDSLGWIQFDGNNVEFISAATWVPYSVGAAEVMEGLLIMQDFEEDGAGRCFLATAFP